MAKFNRFDARNKKHNNHKEKSLQKDLRIREEDSGKVFNKHNVLKEVMFDDSKDQEFLND